MLLYALAAFIFTTSAQSIGYRGEISAGFAFGDKMRLEGENVKSDTSHPFIETVHGITITKYAFIGVGAGVQYYYGAMRKETPSDNWQAITVPLFVNLKGFYPITNITAPFISLSLGTTVVARSNINALIYDIDGAYAIKNQLNGGLYCDFGAGFQVKNFTIGLGLQHQVFSDEISASGHYGNVDINGSQSGDIKFNSFYIKIGACF